MERGAVYADHSVWIMSKPFVSTYDEVFKEAFSKGIQEMPESLPGLVKDILDKVHEEVLQSLGNYIQDEMKSNMDREIMGFASEVTESMLSNALAGDSKEIRNLFGFNEWYMKHLYMGKKPTQWALIDALVARRPDLIIDERISQRDVEIQELNRQISNLQNRIDYLSGERQE